MEGGLCPLAKIPVGVLRRNKIKIQDQIFHLQIER